jgi:hypothetical protein
MRKLLIAACVVALAFPALRAQVACSIGPTLCPHGTGVIIGISNDTPNPIFSVPEPYVVRDLSGAPIYTPIAQSGGPTILPGETQALAWFQFDNAFNQVAPGFYIIEVSIPGIGQIGSEVVQIDANVFAGITRMGVHRPGTTRGVAFVAINDWNLTYAAAASLSDTPGIPTCAGIVPLAQDALFTLSTTPGNPYFQNFVGVMDESGVATGPLVTIPAIPALTGFSIAIGFVTIDVTQACAVRTIGPPFLLTIE